MTRQEFLVKFQDILQCKQPLSDLMELQTIESWDSMAIIETVAFFDDELQLTILFEELRSLDTVGDVVARAGF